MRALAIVASLLLAAIPRPAAANGHGPVFGGATPVLGKGGWQLDQAWMGRVADGVGDDEQMLRTMISFGITEDLQISGSLPITLESGVYMPRGRMMAMMASTQDFEGIVAWRFDRRPIGPGARLESTLFVGGTIPMQEYRKDGMRAAPSFHAAASTGFVSRSQYFWVGGGYQRTMEREFSRAGDGIFYSAVYGLRPPALQLEYPKPDLRFFVEAVGEHTARGEHFGFEMLRSGGSSVLVGPTALLLYKAYALEGGLLIPVYQQTNGLPEEKFRFGVNVTYFFFGK